MHRYEYGTTLLVLDKYSKYSTCCKDFITHENTNIECITMVSPHISEENGICHKLTDSAFSRTIEGGSSLLNIYNNENKLCRTVTLRRIDGDRLENIKYIDHEKNIETGSMFKHNRKMHTSYRLYTLSDSEITDAKEYDVHILHTTLDDIIKLRRVHGTKPITYVCEIKKYTENGTATTHKYISIKPIKVHMYDCNIIKALMYTFPCPHTYTSEKLNSLRIEMLRLEPDKRFKDLCDEPLELVISTNNENNGENLYNLEDYEYVINTKRLDFFLI